MLTATVGLSLVLLLAGAEQTPAQPPAMTVIEDALSKRLECGRDVSVTLASLLTGRGRSLDGVLQPLARMSASSHYIEVRPGERVETLWRATRLHKETWQDDLSFVQQTATQRIEASASFGTERPSLDVQFVPMRDSGRLELQASGLGLQSGETLAAKLHEPKTLTTGVVLRGIDCVELSDATNHIWLAPKLGYAPLRWIDEGGGHSSVSDWLGYRDAHGAFVASLHCHRSVDKQAGAITILMLTRGTALLGQEAREVRPPTTWRVPFIPGMDVSAGGGVWARGSLGWSARDVWRLWDSDGAPWGVSIRKLGDDIACNLPDAEMEAAVAAAAAR